MRIFHRIALFAVLLLACSFRSAHASWPDSVYERIGDDSGRVLAALKSGDNAALSRYVDARRGLRFSPYIFADKSDQKWTRAQVRAAGTARGSKRKYLWGEYDGGVGDIRLSWPQYRRKFVWNRDYTRVAPQFDVFKYRGNTINNLRQIYRNAVFVEYFTTGSKAYDGMDWSSLWLIWQPTGKSWFLSGIAHDQWTI